jgi:hypothetical protein
MPSVTPKQFSRVIEMSIYRVRNAIISNNSDSRLIKKQYPVSVDFNNEEYMNTLVEIYGEQSNIPAVFTKAPHTRLSEVLEKSVCVSYALDLLEIVDCLNSVDSNNLTNFDLSHSNLKLRDRQLDVSLILEETPSVFIQFLADVRGKTAMYLILIGAFFLSMASMGMMIVGAAMAVGGIALGIYTFFSTKEPGITGGFSNSPIPDEVFDKLTEQAVGDAFGQAFS